MDAGRRDADPPATTFPGADGLPLVYREVGEGRPLVLIHGLFSNGWTNWVRYGHAATLAAAGFRVIMPDLRGHGQSAAPHDPAAYPADILAADGEALLAHLDIPEYDLGGYSLGARTVVRMIVRGARPRRTVIGGMGLDGLLDTDARGEFFRQMLRSRGTHRQGSPEWLAEAFLKTTGGDPAALLPLLDSFVATPMTAIEKVPTTALIVAGIDDQDNGSAAALAEAMPRAQYVAVPGNHMSAVLKPELAQAMRDFLQH